MSDFVGSPLFERLQGLLLSVSDIDQFLTELAQIATTVLPASRKAATGPTTTRPADSSAGSAAGVLSCGITVRYDGNLVTVGSSDPRAEVLDETQYRAGAGPCLQALETGLIVDSADTVSEARWPDYTALAVEAGLRCSISFPLTVAGTTFGAMNIYGFEAPNLFGEGQRRQLELFAAQAAGTLRVGTRQIKDTALMAQMEQALGSRSVIDQALGIIMAQQHCSASAAFELLRREAQNSRRRLRDVAADLVTRISGQPPEPGRGFDIN